MILNAILLSRVMAFVETFDLSPRGAVFFPDLIAGMVKNFRFHKFPQNPEDMGEAKGVVFEEGTWGGTTIFKLTILNNGLLIDTRCDTEQTKALVKGALQWAADNFGVAYRDGMIKRWLYVSDLSVTSEAPLVAPNAAAMRLFETAGRHVREIIGKDLAYQPIRLVGDFDRHPMNIPLAAFDIQRRADTPFAENRYFSEAPLPTERHYELLEQYERDLLQGA